METAFASRSVNIPCWHPQLPRWLTALLSTLVTAHCSRPVRHHSGRSQISVIASCLFLFYLFLLFGHHLVSLEYKSNNSGFIYTCVCVCVWTRIRMYWCCCLLSPLLSCSFPLSTRTLWWCVSSASTLGSQPLEPTQTRTVSAAQLNQMWSTAWGKSSELHRCTRYYGGS